MQLFLTSVVSNVQLVIVVAEILLLAVLPLIEIFLFTIGNTGCQPANLKIPLAPKMSTTLAKPKINS